MTPNFHRHGLCLALVSGLLPGCTPATAPAEAGRALDAEVVRSYRDGPPGAAPGTCWGRDVTPAVVETVTEQEQLRPDAADAPVYRTVTRQRIVQEREAIWFRTPCDGEMTPERISTLQRALAARGLHDGAVTGRMDAATRAAVRAYQRPQGLNSGLLSLGAARQLGLVVDDFSKG